MNNCGFQRGKRKHDAPSLGHCPCLLIHGRTLWIRVSEFCQRTVPWVLSSPLALFGHYAVSSSLWPHGLQNARLLCPPLSLRVCSNSCPLSWWCYLTISFSVTLFSFYLQSFPASGSFSMSWLFPSGGPSTAASASASVLPMNIQDWRPLGLTGLISLQFKGLSRVFSNTTVQKHQFFDTQPSLQSNSHICTWLLEKP